MVPMGLDQRTKVREAFHRLYRVHGERGETLSLDQYQGLFPGFTEVVAEEYERLRVRPAPAAASRTPTSGPGQEPPSAAGSAAAPSSGANIGPYRLVGELGRGGMGVVYEARDTRLPRRVALKVLGPHFAGSPHLRLRFEREASIAAKLDHPHICPVYEAGDADGVPYMAMRFVEGRPLSDFIADARGSRPEGAKSSEAVRLPAEGKEDPPPAGKPRTGSTESRMGIARVLGFFEKAARALHAAHEKGLIHRDIKPHNIMVTAEGDPVLLDFGLAREEEGEGQGLTQTGALMGTPAYLSPEQLVAQRIKLDRRTDVYSLGVSLYEALTLRLPFEAPTTDALYQKILASDPEDPRRLNPSLPGDLRVVLETAMEKNRDRRYQTAFDLAEELRRVRVHEPIRARAAGPLLRLRRWVERSPALAATNAALLVTLASGLWISVRLFLTASRDRDAKEAALDTVLREQKANERAFRLVKFQSELVRAALGTATTEGPAEVALSAGGTLRLREGARVHDLRIRGPDPDSPGTRYLYLSRGGADLTIRSGEILATATVQVRNAPGDTPARFHAEPLSSSAVYVRTLADSGPVELVESLTNTVVHLDADQGVLVDSEPDGATGLTVRTDPHNAGSKGDVRVSVPSYSDRILTVAVPKASAVTIRMLPRKTRVEHHLSSWRSGGVVLTIRRADRVTARAELDPGTTATIDGDYGQMVTHPSDGGPAKAPTGPGRTPYVEPGGLLEDSDDLRVRLVSLSPDLDSESPSVGLTLRNEGPPIALLALEVEFRHEAPEGSLTPYAPTFSSAYIEDFRAGETRSIRIDGPPPGKGRPTSVGLLRPDPDRVSATTARVVENGEIRKGTILLNGHVEVVEMEADLVSETPSLLFTLECLGENPPWEDPDNPRFRVQFYRNGVLLNPGRRLAAFRPVGASFTGPGSRIRLEVSGLAAATGLAGAQPVLRLR